MMRFSAYQRAKTGEAPAEPPPSPASDLLSAESRVPHNGINKNHKKNNSSSADNNLEADSLLFEELRRTVYGNDRSASLRAVDFFEKDARIYRLEGEISQLRAQLTEAKSRNDKLEASERSLRTTSRDGDNSSRPALRFITKEGTEEEGRDRSLKKRVPKRKSMVMNNSSGALWIDEGIEWMHESDDCPSLEDKSNNGGPTPSPPNSCDDGERWGVRAIADKLLRSLTL